MLLLLLLWRERCNHLWSKQTNSSRVPAKRQITRGFNSITSTWISCILIIIAVSRFSAGSRIHDEQMVKKSKRLLTGFTCVIIYYSQRSSDIY